MTVFRSLGIIFERKDGWDMKRLGNSSGGEEERVE